MSLATLLTHSVEIQRLSQTDDDYGGQTNEWETSIASYSCRIYTATGQFDVKDIGGYTGKTQKMIGASANILENDKIIDGTDEYIVSKVYKVYNGSAIHHLEALLDKVKKWVS